MVDEGMQPFFSAMVELMFHVIEHPAQGRDTLRGRAMECITSLGRAVGRDTYRPVAQKFMDATLSALQVCIRTLDPGMCVTE